VAIRKLWWAGLALWLAGCAPELAMQSAWQPDGRAAAPFSNVLVVGVSQSFDRRRFFEQAAAEALAAPGVQVTASTSRMKASDPLDRDTVAGLVKAIGADAVVVTRIVDQAAELKAQPEREVLKQPNPANTVTAYDPAAYILYRYDYSTTEEAPVPVVARQAIVTTEVFAVADGRLVYRIDSVVQVEAASNMRSSTSDVALLDRVGRGLGNRLRRDGVVR
jgi:hypothetical protein